MDLKLVKIGGKLIEDDEVLENLCQKLVPLYPGLILVHGGGTIAGELATRLGIEVKMHEGRRITDKATLDIAVMAYAGLANKKVVAQLQKKGINACGLSGCDMNIIQAHKREGQEIDWGFVGDVDKVDAYSLQMLLDRNIVPVISPITFSETGQLLNTNADSIASAVGIALSKFYDLELIFCFDKPGVLLNIEDESSVIAEITKEDYKRLTDNQMIYSGMLPKLENAFRLLEAGVKRVRLTGVNNLNGGTVVK